MSKGSLNSILGPPSEPLAYDPHPRVSDPHSVLIPITTIEELQCSNPTGNPLRLIVKDQITPRGSNKDDAFDGTISYKRSASPLPEPQRKKQKAQGNADLQIAGHYNARPNLGVDKRKESPIIGLKNFNNWIKSVLIAKYGRREKAKIPKLKVLDLGCGKGGDLLKWSRAGTDEYIGIDLAAVSVEQARTRWREMRGSSFTADFLVLDCFGRSISEVLRPEHVKRPFDIVSMQFCMHYAFDSEARVRQMLANVSLHLRPGGTFIGTIPDSMNLLAQLGDVPEDADPIAFGNQVYRIEFDERDTTPRYGHRYTFFLTEAVEDVPEYVVYWDEFEALAKEYGLESILVADFQRIFDEDGEDPDFKELLKKMRVVDRDGNTGMTMDQWEAANIYMAFAFKKRE